MNYYEKDYLKSVVKNEVNEINKADGEFMLSMIGKCLFVLALLLIVTASCISAENLVEISQYLKGLQ